MMERVVIDANILFSNMLRSFFLWLHWNDTLEIVWTKELWEEVFRNYSENGDNEFRPKMEATVLVKFAACMRKLNPGFDRIGLPDENDEHVVAIARQEQIKTVVTFNLKDFPKSLLEKHALEGKHPDAYLCELLDRDYDSVVDAIERHLTANQVTKPKKKDYFEALTRVGVPNFSQAIQKRDAAEKSIPEVWS